MQAEIIETHFFHVQIPKLKVVVCASMHASSGATLGGRKAGEEGKIVSEIPGAAVVRSDPPGLL